MSNLNEKIQTEIMNGYWSDLREHSDRDAIFLVAPELELLEVGVKIASDDAEAVGQWIASGQLRRPTKEQVQAWSNTDKKTFLFLILQPHVLIQERPN